MHPTEGDPRTASSAGLDTAADRRRPGRRAATNPQLLPLLRGEEDPDAPADPAPANLAPANLALARPGQAASSRDIILGAAITSALLLAGAILRFAI